MPFFFVSPGFPPFFCYPPVRGETKEKGEREREKNGHVFFPNGNVHMARGYYGRKGRRPKANTLVLPQAPRVGLIRVFLGNDPTAGSPTVTLLRLLLPLNDQV